jgi:putative ABC transport system substrate-binding protein
MHFDQLKRREFITFLGGAAVAWSLATHAQQPGKLPLVGVLVSASPPHPFADALRRGLQNLGYSEGQNIAFEVRYSGGRSDRAAEIATEFVRLGVDVIVAHFTPAVRASLGATQTIPIVIAPAGAPLQSGFIDSLARPGGNVTGLSGMDAEIGGKRLQLLGDLIPNLARVAVLASTTATDPFSGPFVENLRLAATRTSLQLEPILVSGPNEFESAFAAMAKAGAQAVIIQGFFDPHRAILVERDQAPAGAHVGQPGNHRSGWPHFYLRELFSPLRARCALCRQNYQRCEPGHSTGGTAHEIPGRAEHENGASAWPDDITDAAR